MGTTIVARGAGPPGRHTIRAWPIWAVPPLGRAFLMGCELLALALVAGLLARTSPSSVVLVRYVVLCAFAVGYAELADRVERTRRYLASDQVWANQVSVWAFAGTLVLPAAYAGLLVITVYAHILLLGRRHRSARPYRVVFGGATVVLGALAGSTFLTVSHTRLTGGAAGAAGIGVALIVFTGASLIAMLTGSYLATTAPSLRGLLPGSDEVSFEAATLILGVVTAALLTTLPWLTPGVLVLLAVLHRSCLVRQLQVLATTDARTGLLNPVAWARVADNALQRRRRGDTGAAVLLLDLDHFKAVNDTFGHLIGDAVLGAVAETLRQELRGYDAVSRYGGDEFIAYLDHVDAEAALVIAERVRRHISELRVHSDLSITASIGIALTSTDSATADTTKTLIAAADMALYQAKGEQRNQTRIAPPSDPVASSA